ncbi:hypothetical protein C8R45DRAFT_945257 [Mycena sanguinolenta]|nr:hypothetical protein C8R45DRAFT_945257 [Mycena sanguinolenta]
MPLLPVPILPVLLPLPPLVLCRIHIRPRPRVYPTKSDARAVDAAKSVAMDEMEEKSRHLKWMMRRRSNTRRKRKKTPSRIPTPVRESALRLLLLYLLFFRRGGDRGTRKYRHPAKRQEVQQGQEHKAWKQ